MRHKVTIAVCVAAAVVLSILSVQAYNRYRAQHVKQVVQQSEAAVQAANARAAAQANFKGQVTNLQALCQKDLAAYNALPAATKAKSVAPNCNVQFVQ